jgi:hypothetical protein
MKLDLLANATVVDDAIRFVSDHSSNKRMISKEENRSKESKESGYNEENTDKQGEEEKQEEEIGEKTMAETTTNQVF